MSIDKKFRVLKFGGSSLANIDNIRQVLSIIKELQSPPALIVSAARGITDLLLTTATQSAAGNAREIGSTVETYRSRHVELIDKLIQRDQAKKELFSVIHQSADEYRAICQSLLVLREFTPKTMAKSVCRGEQVMARIITEAAIEIGIEAVFVDASDVIKVTRGPTGMYPDPGLCEAAAALLIMPHLTHGRAVVIPGFYGSISNGDIVTLGRGGSDYSATTIAASINALEVLLYKEVNGLMTADPSYVKEARIVPEFHYREAAEMAFYGAKILHPNSIIPLILKQIPLIIKNTFNPHLEGTRIAGDVLPGAYPVKALTAISGQAILSIEGNGMMGIPGVAGRTFSTLARLNISVAMISQSSSESSICFIIMDSEAAAAKEALKIEFRFELEHLLIDDIKVKLEASIIAVVGLGMSGTRGCAARAFSAIAREDINVEAIAQGSSELNISFALKSSEVPIALNTLHREFKLDKVRPLAARVGGEINIVVFGFGQIGRALIEQILRQEQYFKEKMQIDCRVVALADSSGLVVREQGFAREDLIALMETKANGTKLDPKNLTKKTLANFSSLLKQNIWSKPFSKGVFIDLTAEDSASLIKTALEQGYHVVLANKKPLATSYREYEELLKLSRTNRVMIRYEATVGAGLPVLDTIAKLEAAGDEVKTLLGCLSGTLGYLMTEVEDGTSFSAAVRKAYELGYTEPDPREDLSGKDVARKALILSRTLGFKIDLEEIHLEPLFPAELSNDNPQVFLENLKVLDVAFSRRVKEAKNTGNVLRYVARIAENKVSVRIESVPKSSALGRLRGTDNQLTICTRRYDKNPLILSGPGAGDQVTAAGVLNDLVAIATAYDRI